jgi:hypothetical protein
MVWYLELNMLDIFKLFLNLYDLFSYQITLFINMNQIKKIVLLILEDLELIAESIVGR